MTIATNSRRKTKCITVTGNGTKPTENIAARRRCAHSHGRTGPGWGHTSPIPPAATVPREGDIEEEVHQQDGAPAQVPARPLAAASLIDGKRGPQEMIAAARIVLVPKPSISITNAAVEGVASTTPIPASPTTIREEDAGEVVHLQAAPPPPLTAWRCGAVTVIPIAAPRATNIPTGGMSRAPSTNPWLVAMAHPVSMASSVTGRMMIDKGMK